MTTNPTPAPLSPEREAEIRKRLGYDPMKKIRLAISDPGAFTARGDNYEEPLVQWQARALMAAIGENLFEELDGHVEANHELYTELNRVRAERQETNAALVEQTVALRAAEKRVETVTEYGIRVPGADWPDDGVFQDGDTFDLKDQQGRLLSYRDCWPDAVLVSRPVHRGEWTEAE